MKMKIKEQNEMKGMWNKKNKTRWNRFMKTKIKSESFTLKNIFSSTSLRKKCEWNEKIAHFSKINTIIVITYVYINFFYFFFSLSFY